MNKSDKGTSFFNLGANQCSNFLLCIAAWLLLGCGSHAGLQIDSLSPNSKMPC